MNQEQLREILELASAAKDSHYLFPTESPELVRLRIQQTDAYQPLVSEIRKAAEPLLTEGMPDLTYTLFCLYAENGSRSEYERVYFHRRKRLTTFALMAWLEPENEAYTEALWNTIWSICEEYTWCLPAHILHGPEMNTAFDVSLDSAAKEDKFTIDLFAAETAFTLSEIVTLFGEFLPTLLHRRVREEVSRRVLQPFIMNGPFEWEAATHNWAAVCAGSIGAAAIYLLSDASQLSVVLQRVLPAMDSYLRGFEADGACTEGYLYWQYGFGFYVYFADLLKRRTGGTIDLFASEKVRQIALFQQKCFLGERKVVNFSDSLPECGIFMGLSHYLHGIYEDGFEVPEDALRAGYQDDHCSRWAPAVRNLLWFRPDVKGRPWRSASHYLSDAQWLVSRHSTQRGHYVFAAKGGHNDEPHNHNDIGQFILYANGETLLTDLGSGQYTRDYFGPHRYGILCNGSQGHSVPVINGQYQREGAVARAKVLEATHEAERETFAIEFASAYEVKSLRSLERRFVWLTTEAPCLELEDTFVFTQVPDSIIERLMSWEKPVAADDGRLVIHAGASRVYIEFEDAQLDWRTEELRHVDHFGKRRTCYAVDFIVKRPAERLTVKLTFALK